jgi:hypothetical protein
MRRWWGWNWIINVNHKGREIWNSLLFLDFCVYSLHSCFCFRHWVSIVTWQWKFDHRVRSWSPVPVSGWEQMTPPRTGFFGGVQQMTPHRTGFFGSRVQMVRHRTGGFGGVQQMIPHRCGPVPCHLYQGRNRFLPKSVLETGLQDGFGDRFLSFFKLQKKIVYTVHNGVQEWVEERSHKFRVKKVGN